MPQAVPDVVVQGKALRGPVQPAPQDGDPREQLSRRERAPAGNVKRGVGSGLPVSGWGSARLGRPSAYQFVQVAPQYPNSSSRGGLTRVSNSSMTAQNLSRTFMLLPHNLTASRRHDAGRVDRDGEDEDQTATGSRQ